MSCKQWSACPWATVLLVGRAPQFFFAQLPLHTSWTSAPVTLPQVPGVVDNPGLVSWGAPLMTATGEACSTRQVNGVPSGLVTKAEWSAGTTESCCTWSQGNLVTLLLSKQTDLRGVGLQPVWDGFLNFFLKMCEQGEGHSTGILHLMIQSIWTRAFHTNGLHSLKMPPIIHTLTVQNLVQSHPLQCGLTLWLSSNE